MQHEREVICLVWPMIKDRFKITLKAAADKILYISFPNPASDAFPITKPCLQNWWGGSSRTLAVPGNLIKQVNVEPRHLLHEWHFTLLKSRPLLYVIDILKTSTLLKSKKAWTSMKLVAKLMSNIWAVGLGLDLFAKVIFRSILAGQLGLKFMAFVYLPVITDTTNRLVWNRSPTEEAFDNYEFSNAEIYLVM